MATTRFPNGVTTANNGAPFGEFILPDMTKVHTFFDDFDFFGGATNWTITPVGAATTTLLAAGTPGGDGGRLVLTNAAANLDSVFLQKISESFLLSAGKQAWFDSLFQVSDGMLSDVIMGLQITDTTPLDVTDGVFFIKDAGNRDIRLEVEKNGVATPSGTLATLQDATDIRLSWFYDGIDRIRIYVNGLQVASSVTTNIPDDQTITLSFGIVNGEAVAKTMTVDYILAAKER